MHRPYPGPARRIVRARNAQTQRGPATSAQGAEGCAYSVRMTNRWGNDDHGPGGDPSWLGGGDRDGGAVPERGQGSGRFSSDFASDFSRDPRSSQGARRPAESDFSERDKGQAAESMAPRFGEVTGDAAISEDRDQGSAWASSFTGHSGEGQGRSRSGRSIVAQVIGLLGSSVGLIVFAIFFYRMGFDMWWILLGIGFPLVVRVVRLIRRNLGG